MSGDLIKADDLARELGVGVADLFERALLGTMPSPYWRRDELAEWVAHWPARHAAAQSGEGGSDE